ncbi:MAG: hypothetical protein QXK06_04360 [Candidatus Diapherotrites archaeon]
MNKELEDVVKAYATKPHSELNALLLGKSKDDLIAVINNILTIYFNDRNSSTMREYVTVSLAGYKPSEKKIGYNGFKQDTSIGGKIIACECKPKNVVTSDEQIKKLSGGANFTDYTFERFKRDKKENVNILMSGFVDGHLIYAIEFPFNCPTFVRRLAKVLKRRFPKGDISGQYLRSATFRLADYKDCPQVKLIYLDRIAMKANKKFITKQLCEFLNDISQKQK